MTDHTQSYDLFRTEYARQPHDFIERPPMIRQIKTSQRTGLIPALIMYLIIRTTDDRFIQGKQLSFKLRAQDAH